MTRDEAEAAYDVQLDRLANSLHALADKVRTTGSTYRLRPGFGAKPEGFNRVWLATDVQQLVLKWVGEHNSHLVCLLFAAVEAEHATARATPGQLLDSAIGALEQFGTLPADGAQVTLPREAAGPLAEIALRGAGVIR